MKLPVIAAMILLAVLLNGCAADPRDIGLAPEMTPIGDGLVQETAAIPVADN